MEASGAAAYQELVQKASAEGLALAKQDFRRKFKAWVKIVLLVLVFNMVEWVVYFYPGAITAGLEVVCQSAADFFTSLWGTSSSVKDTSK